MSAGELAARVLDWAGLVLGSVDGLSVGVHKTSLVPGSVGAGLESKFTWVSLSLSLY